MDLFYGKRLAGSADESKVIEATNTMTQPW
jgi:hypothetical protein